MHPLPSSLTSSTFRSMWFYLGTPIHLGAPEGVDRTGKSSVSDTFAAPCRGETVGHSGGVLNPLGHRGQNVLGQRGGQSHPLGTLAGLCAVPQSRGRDLGSAQVGRIAQSVLSAFVASGYGTRTRNPPLTHQAALNPILLCRSGITTPLKFSDLCNAL
jgi:hypothetical protein